MSEIWSGTDFPYMCLKDRVRTEAFRRAIAEVVRPGDVMVDAGAGTGILSFFAAANGAGRVYAVEIDPLLVANLRASVALNGLEGVVSVVSGDATQADLPHGVDVFVGELVDTGLLDEMQVEVVNTLRARGVIGPATRLIPAQYTTFAELVAVDESYYGFRIVAPKHEWPFYATADPTWQKTAIRPLTERVPVAHVDFRNAVEPAVSRDVGLTCTGDGLANAIRLSGTCRLSPTVSLGATNAFNGDKILHLPGSVRTIAGQTLGLRVEFAYGKGLGSFGCHVDSAPHHVAPVPGKRLVRRAS
ncbi:MAG TPA: 50S ribosomal protein L11 methyltransferase [Thermomicrobiales bacterium]|jgi:hypothetical protein